MPSIVIVTQVFPPETHPTAVMVAQLCAHLRDRGWRVSVGAGYPHHPTGSVYPGYAKRPWTTENHDGLLVRRTWHVTTTSRAIPKRAAVFVSQALAMAIGGLRSGAADVVLAFGPPLVGPLLAGAVAGVRRAGLVNVIYDVYPDIAVATGKVRNPLVIGAARVAERLQYAASRRTVVLSDGLRDRLVERGVPAERIEVVPIWLDTDEIRPLDRDNPWCREQALGPEKTVFLYAGTIGVISGATIVVETADRLRDRKDLLFLFVGEGADKDAVVRRAAELNLDNVRCLPFQPRERLAELQSAADVGLVTLLPGMGRTSVPSKVLGYMAARRPVLASVDADSDTGIEVARHDLGLVTPPADPDALAVAALRLADDPALRGRLGANGRRRVEQHYCRSAALARFERVLRDVAEGR